MSMQRRYPVVNYQDSRSDYPVFRTHRAPLELPDYLVMDCRHIPATSLRILAQRLGAPDTATPPLRFRMALLPEDKTASRDGQLPCLDYQQVSTNVTITFMCVFLSFFFCICRIDNTI